MTAPSSTTAIALTCVDHRLHEPSIVPQLSSVLGADHIYVRTTAGPEGRILLPENGHHLASQLDDLRLLIDAKGARTVALIGHCDCAGHQVSDAQHERDVVEAGRVLLTRLERPVELVTMVAHPPEVAGEPWKLRTV